MIAIDSVVLVVPVDIFKAVAVTSSSFLDYGGEGGSSGGPDHRMNEGYQFG